jgi:hypothetical protein
MVFSSLLSTCSSDLALSARDQTEENRIRRFSTMHASDVVSNLRKILESPIKTQRDAVIVGYTIFMLTLLGVYPSIVHD